MSDFIYLPACATEDSTDCYWDATTQGNGTGTSFIDIDGVQHTVTVPEGSYILSAVAFTDGTPGVAYQAYPEAAQGSPAYAVDLTLPVVIVAAALAACGVALVTGFLKRG